MKVVLDANIIIAAIGWPGRCRRIMRICLQRQARVLSPDTLVEVRRVVLEKLPDHRDEAAHALAQIAQGGLIVQPTPLPSDVCRDPADVRLLGAALAANAKCLVTGDRDLLALHPFRNIPILTPADFETRFLSTPDHPE